MASENFTTGLIQFRLALCRNKVNSKLIKFPESSFELYFPEHFYLLTSRYIFNLFWKQIFIFVVLKLMLDCPKEEINGSSSTSSCSTSLKAIKRPL